MIYKAKKQLKKLSNKQFAEDIKRYIKSTHEFYGARIPEIKVLAKRLHDEHDLKDFYKVFNRLWKTGYHGEMSLAIYTFQLYKDEFDFDTWRFLKSKLREMKSWDQIDSVSINIIGEILLKYPQLGKEILRLAKSKDIWLKRIALVSTLPLIKKGNIDFAIKLINLHLYSKEKPLQKIVGWILKEIGDKKPEIAKRYILKNINMPQTTFDYATEHMKELRKLKQIKKLKTDKKGFLWWRV